MKADTVRTLLLSELFPPRFGGTPTWFHAVYSRYPAGAAMVVTDRQPGDQRFDVGQALAIYRVPMRFPDWGVSNPRALMFYARLVASVWRVARRHGVREIHCGRVMPEGVVASVLRRLTGIPYSVYAHGEEIGTARSSGQLTLLMRKAYAGAERVIANSANTQALLRNIGVPEARIVIIHPGVDHDRFRPSAESETTSTRIGLAGHHILLTVGRLQRRKGHDTMLRALPIIARKVPDLHYVIAGTGEEEDRLRTLADEVGVTKLVTFAGHVSDAELPALYQSCDVFVMPNREEAGRDIEGFGIVFLEAAACARPVVGGRSGGVREAVVDGETGLLVDGHDPEAVAGAVLSLLGDPARAAAMGRRGRKRVEQEFGWEAIAARTMALAARKCTWSQPTPGGHR